ncbi:hypothetical protein JCM10908_005704 [Rhodotorula pacifica]|uniref:uncharacterized protein n=1 Tax=Rhodotorula pacifica TaxID=1495444 RepID=UPI00317F23DB
MSALCTYCATQSSRLAQSVVPRASRSVAPRSLASATLNRSSPTVTVWTARSLHSTRFPHALWTDSTTTRRLGPSTPAAPQPPMGSLQGAPRRFIACPAEPPANPSEDFEPVEEELKEGEALEMHLTEAAIKQIERAQAKAGDTTLSLRLAVESGGCHGYQYKMQVTNRRDADDYRFAPPTPTTASLLVDSSSLPLVKGSTIDYATELIGSAFRIRDNPQSKDAGCGCGVSWELKDI